MQTFKPSQEDAQKLVAAAYALKEAYRQQASAKKALESAKSIIDQWLKAERKTDLEKLPVGESIHIEGVVIINIKERKDIDRDKLLAEEPTMHARFYLPKPVAYWSPEIFRKT